MRILSSLTREQATAENGQLFQQMVLEHWTSTLKIRHRPYIIHKINSKMIMDINVNFKITKFLEDVIIENPDDRYGRNVLDSIKGIDHERNNSKLKKWKQK